MKNIRVRRLESRFRARSQTWHICTASVTVALLASNIAHLESSVTVALLASNTAYPYSKCHCGTAGLKHGTSVQQV